MNDIISGISSKQSEWWGRQWCGWKEVGDVINFEVG